MYNLEFLPAAREDIVNILKYINDTLQNPSAAKKLSGALAESIAKLKDFPYAHPAYYPLRPLAHEYRRLMVARYCIFYWVDEARSAVIIARILYARRDFDSILSLQ